MNTMVEVFKTNVNEASQARLLIAKLLQHFPDHIIHIDLHDCDKVLRVQGENFTMEKVLDFVREHGYDCIPLES